MKKIIGMWVLSYLRYFAKKQLAKNPRAITIGITGSSGKTSTRLALYQILKTRGVVKHSAHANSESGISLNILGINLKDYSLLSWIKVIVLAPYRYFTFNERYDYYIVEMGIDSPHPPKNMDYLLSIIRPDMAIILGASLVHAQAFDHLVKDTSPSRKAKKILNLIAREKMKLAHSLNSSGVVVINKDDPALSPHLNGLKARILQVGHSPQADFKLDRVRVTTQGFRMQMKYLGHDHELELKDIFGEEYAYTFAAAIAIGHSLGLSLKHCFESLKSYRAPAGRMRIFEGINQTHIIDSSYNASPSTMLKALTTLSSVAARSHKIAVLGDMRELGNLSKVSHQTLARQIPNYADSVLLFGPLMREYVLPILVRQKFPVVWAPTMTELVDMLKEQLRPNAWILIKGSQNTILLERAVATVLAKPQDVNLLCRRGRYWDRIRQRTQ